jgi:hypothetical protein
MKTLKKLTKQQRLKIVMDIINKLKHIPANNEKGYIDIYRQEYPSMKMLKNIFNEYVKQEDETLIEMVGKIDFPELNRKIYYILPANTRRQPLFKMEWKNE